MGFLELGQEPVVYSRVTAGMSIRNCWESNVSAFYMLCRFVIAFFPRSKCLLTSWLKSPSAVIFEPKKIQPVTVSFVSSIICHEVMGPEAMILLFEY